MMRFNGARVASEALVFQRTSSAKPLPVREINLKLCALIIPQWTIYWLAIGLYPVTDIRSLGSCMGKMCVASEGHCNR